MSYTLTSITPRIRARLNDTQVTGGSIYTDNALLPFAQDACDELQGMIELYGILAIETITSNPITIPANTLSMSYTSSPAIPANILEPQRIEERLAGSTDMFVMMTRRQWEPDVLPTDSLRYWTYREEEIFFVGSNVTREIKIYGTKRLFNIQTIGDTINLNNSQMFLITRIAALAAQHIGENYTRAKELNDEADKNLDWLLRIGIKSKQGARTRRRPYIITSRRRWV